MKSFIRSSLAIFVTLALISVIGFGLAHQSFGMSVNNEGRMTGCLFDGRSEICTMSFSQHIQAWQSMFTATPVLTTPLMLLSLISALIALAVICRFRIANAAEKAMEMSWLYLRQLLDISIFNPLRYAFSQGILNPKIYNTAF